MSSVRVVLLSVALFAAASCAARVTGPDHTGPVRLTAHVNRIQIASLATATATFRVENGSPNTVTLHFNSGCQIMPFIVKQPNQVVYPAGGGWACTLALTELTLPPNGVSIVEVTVINGSSQGELVGLAPGDYVLYARLDSQELELESERVTLQVLD